VVCNTVEEVNSKNEQAFTNVNLSFIYFYESVKHKYTQMHAFEKSQEKTQTDAEKKQKQQKVARQQRRDIFHLSCSLQKHMMCHNE